jgi:hypothetical protein
MIPDRPSARPDGPAYREHRRPTPWGGQVGRLLLAIAAGGLTLAQARQILWMLASRDMYRMLVEEGGWGPSRFQAWLSRTLVEALAAQDHDGAEPRDG